MKNQNYPLNTVTPFSSIREMMEIAVREAGDRIAFKYLVDGDVKEVTYRRFREDQLALGEKLYSMGLTGTHVACIGPNAYCWVCAYLTMLQTDGVFVPLDKELPPLDIVNVLVNSDSEVLFYTEAYEDMLREHLSELSSIRYFIGFDRREDSVDGRFLSYEKLLQSGYEMRSAGHTDYEKIQGDPYSLRLLVYTSGTTGMAKGVMLTEHNLVSCVYYGLQISTVYDCCLSVLPYHHTYESVCGLLVSMHKHATICINDKLRAVLRNIQLFKPSYIYLVPAFAELFYKKIWASVQEKGKDKLLRRMIAMSDGMRKVGIDMRKKLFAEIHKTFGGNLRKIVCGGAPIRPEVGQFFDSIGITLVNGYGITECSPLVSANRDYFNNFETAGVPLPCINVTIENVNEDGLGEIAVKGDTVMLGYYKNPEETAKVLVDGKFYTGDYGTINERGQLVITGRKKNLIVLSNGKNIYPEEIENYIQGIPYVSEVIVSSVLDEKGAESALCAEIYCDSEKVAELDIKDISASLRHDVSAACAQLPAYKHIQKILVRQTPFDKTTSNKIKRNYAK